MKTAQRVANNEPNRRVSDTRQSSGQSPLAQINDNRPEVVAQRELMDGIHNSPRMVTQKKRIKGYLNLSPGNLTNPVNLNLIRPQMQIQAKLVIGQPNDRYEQEADRVALQVVEQINAPNSGKPMQEQPKHHQALAGKNLQTKSALQLHGAIQGGEASNYLESAINHAKGGGQPLVKGLQETMGQTMGVDFSGVRVHTDAKADQLNQSIQAQAFTTGQDVFFRHGVYEPGSRSGQALIAHELTHVVQQNGTAIQPSHQSKRPHIVAENRLQKKIIQRMTKAEAEAIDSFEYGSVTLIDIGRNPHKTQDQNILWKYIWRADTPGLRDIELHWHGGEIIAQRINIRWLGETGEGVGRQIPDNFMIALKLAAKVKGWL